MFVRLLRKNVCTIEWTLVKQPSLRAHFEVNGGGTSAGHVIGPTCYYNDVIDVIDNDEAKSMTSSLKLSKQNQGRRAA